MLNKKNLKLRNSKDKRKGFERKKQDRKPKKEKILMKKKLPLNI